MTKEEVLRLSSLGETSTVQFKERIYDAYKIASLVSTKKS